MPSTVSNPLPTLESLTSALTSAVSSLPSKADITPPSDGISLLDLKNELFLSYLQNLAFLALLKVRDGKKRHLAAAAGGSDAIVVEGKTVEKEEDGRGGEPVRQEEDDGVVRKLVELRVYLEKGVRPLEGRLKYQLDKVLRAAEDDDAKRREEEEKKKRGERSGDRADGSPVEDEDEDEDEEEEYDDDDDVRPLNSRKPNSAPASIDELSYRPNPSSLLRPSHHPPAAAAAATAASHDTSTTSDRAHSDHNRPYRPPRITPTLPPQQTLPSSPSSNKARRPLRSATLDEFISHELSSAPQAEPSVGSTIARGGRANTTARERRLEAERREYEEANFVRLPGDAAAGDIVSGRKKGKRDQQRGGYGGEEWRGLGEGAERIERLTRRSSAGGGAGGRERDMLERSRKRGAMDEVMDEERGGRLARPGERFEFKRRKLAAKARRSKGRAKA